MLRTSGRIAIACLIFGGLGCAVGSEADAGTSFGSATYSTTVTTTADSGTDESTGDSTDSGTTTDDSTTTSTSTDTGTTDTGTTDTGTTGTTSTDTTDTSGTTTGGGGQPQQGMYSMCLDPADCMGVPTCITLGNPPTDGICSTDCAGANNPANCDAAPQGATATPTCMVFDDGMGGWRYLCALGCDNGKSCPNGMQCTNVMDGMSAKLICF